ncbi:MAG: head GIN domain-containing protein [Ginsengibacter sp.]
MKKLPVLIIAAIMLVLSSCKKINGEGDLITETRTTGDFSGIDSRISGDVMYMQGTEYKIELTAQPNVLNVIETPIINNKVVIRFKDDVRVRSHEQITVKITAPSINSIDLSGSGNVTALSPVNGNALYFKLSGSGNLSLPSVITTSLEATISGSGNISISNGSTVTQTFRISGSGNIDAQNVAGKSAITSTSGSGTIKLNATETLDVTISGSGSVFYSGRPIIKTNISGSGHVTHL